MSRPTQDTAKWQSNLPVRGFHALWQYFPECFQFILCHFGAVLQPRTCRNKHGLGCSPFARRYSGNRSFFILLLLLRCFSSEGLLILADVTRRRAGLPHSEIAGSILVCKSPALIAAYHVLPRLQEPRHPPCALYYFLTYSPHHAFCTVVVRSLYLILNNVNVPQPLAVFSAGAGYKSDPLQVSRSDFTPAHPHSLRVEQLYTFVRKIIINYPLSIINS